MSQREMEMKSFGPFEIKSEDRGEVVAIVATLGVVDKDGDVILPGAVPPEGAKVKLSGFDHDSVLKSLPPVGRGVITEQADKLVFSGKFFMSTERGREAFNYVREMGADGEWSFGFPRATKNATLTDEWRTKGAKRLIAGMEPFEASPVLVGAGWGTQTVLTKAAEGSAEPTPTPVAQADGDPAAPALEPPSEPTAPSEPEVKAMTASVDGEDHPASDFAYVPDPEKPSTWKFPVFDADHARNALARFNQADLPAGDREGVWRKILAACHKFGVHVSDTMMPKSAAEVADLVLKAARDEAMEEYHRVQRALRRMGLAA